MPQRPLETIATLEDARSDGGGLLEVLRMKGAVQTRLRATVALGRLPYPEQGESVTLALCAALSDESAEVRSAAAFAIGERGDRAASGALLDALDEKVDEVRARMVEAASRIEGPEMHAAVLRALKDPAPEVRIEAALGPARWPVNAPATAASDSTPEHPGISAADRSIDAVLIDVVSGATKPAASGEQAGERPVTKAALFSLMRRKSPDAHAVFLEHAADPADAEIRIFAIQGLGNITSDSATIRALCAALGDGDWRVVCEAALALGKHPDCESLPALAAQAHHKSAHVRRCVYEALGNFSGCKDSVRSILEQARIDPSANVQGAALEAEAKLFGDESVQILEAELASKDPLIRAAVASAAAHLSSRFAVPMLIRLSNDPNRRVADIATHGLEEHPTEAARARLRELLLGPDNGLRLAAVEALRKQKNPEDLPLLKQCFETAQGEISCELAFGVLESAAAFGGPEALVLLEQGLSFDDPYVRKKARELIAKNYPQTVIPSVSVPDRKPAQVLVKGRDLLYDANPRVEIRTSKGSMVFELLPDETPLHVGSFLELVSLHHYDDLTFHRVVPDFVIQGGDVRGDGNGGASWRGDALRSEFTPRKFYRGAMGMPRNEDPDSGGSQIFVTQRWTPHLDGRYTLFGLLISGGEVLDTIEVGDTILEVKRLPTHSN
jgi:cyclophilin family peptidyl-prolyl cis-trans isomerase/HEAT repeat protein